MTAERIVPVVVVVHDDASYVAIGDMLADRGAVQIPGGVVEHGWIVRDGVRFHVFLTDDSRRDLVTLREHASSPPASILIDVLPVDGPTDVGDAVALQIGDADSMLEHVVGNGFEDRVKLIARRGVALGERNYQSGVQYNLRTIEIDRSSAPVVASVVQLAWVGFRGTHRSLPTSDFARLVLELSLRAIALDVPPQSTTAPVPVAPRVVPPPATGLLDAAVVDDLKGLHHLRWPLAGKPGFHVVLGQNASGKTTLLRAVVAALLPHDEVGALRQDWARWIRIGAAAATCEASFAPDVAARWQIAGGQLEKSGHAYAGFSAAYGPFRRFTGGDVEYQREFEAHRRLLRHLSLFSERVALSDALKWLQDLEFRRAKEQPEGEAVERLRDFINRSNLLPTGVTLSRIDPDGVWFTDANGVELPADELSDGYRAILSLTLDLLRHLAAEVDPAALFVEQGGTWVVAAAGVVVIDEVDAHLHPTWQQRVGHWFKRHFPGVQFLVATHSAIVCQAADSVLLLPDPGTAAEPRMLTPTELDRLRYGDLIDAYGTGVFGDGVTRSEASRQKLDRLAELNILELQSPLTDAQRAEQRDLRRVLPSEAFAHTPDTPRP